MMQAEMNVKLSEQASNELYAQMYMIAQQAVNDATQTTEKLFYTHNEVREILRCGDATLNKYYAMGLPAIKQNRTRLIYKQDLIDFMRNLAN